MNIFNLLASRNIPHTQRESGNLVLRTEYPFSTFRRILEGFCIFVLKHFGLSCYQRNMKILLEIEPTTVSFISKGLYKLLFLSIFIMKPISLLQSYIMINYYVSERCNFEWVLTEGRSSARFNSNANSSRWYVNHFSGLFIARDD